MSAAQAKPVLVIGAGGRLGRAVLAACAQAGLRHQAWRRAQWDLVQTVLGQGEAGVPQLPAEVACALAACQPSVIVNCAAVSDVDLCERDPELADRVNHRAPAALADWCQQAGVDLIHVSTDYVFGEHEPRDPEQGFAEDEDPAPVNAYGLSKWRGEQAVLAACQRALVARVAWLHGPGEAGFVSFVLNRARQQQPVPVSLEQVSVPTSLAQAARLVVGCLGHELTEQSLVDAGESASSAVRPKPALRVFGIRHLVCSGLAWRSAWAREVIEQAVQVGLIDQAVPVQLVAQTAELPARRPRYTPLSNRRLAAELGCPILGWQAGIADTIARWPRNA